MSFENLYLVKCLMDQRVSASLRETESLRVLREAGIDHQPRIIRGARRWLYRLGHRLVVLGQQLVHYDASLERHQPASHGQSAQA